MLFLRERGKLCAFFIDENLVVRNGMMHACNVAKVEIGLPHTSEFSVELVRIIYFSILVLYKNIILL